VRFALVKHIVAAVRHAYVTAMTLNDASTPLSLLHTRRSGRPREMVEPGPSEAEIAEMVTVAARTPDHGKLAPWRFVHVTKDSRAAFADLLHRALRQDNPEPSRLDIEATDRYATQAPELVVAIFSPVVPHKIPMWEQELSCGAACMNLLIAAHALGYTGGWITGWPAYSELVRRAFARDGERIAGFMYLGTPGIPLEDRPRPELADVLSRWQHTVT
jgi:nitroreductase